MAFQSVKNSAYFSRYQTKYRRRREGKTDYYARKRLISQAKNKYNAPKYRLVVRISNRFVTCQIVSSKVNVGFANWTAAYATGLLVARRALIKLGLDKKYEGVVEPEGEFELTEAIEDGPRPFKVFLDVGLKRTSTGARVFGAMKGASDGGLYVPHSPSRFPGWDIETEELDDETLRKYIYGGHVAEYMEMLIDDDEERYQKQFSSLIADGIESDQLEDIYAPRYGIKWGLANWTAAYATGLLVARRALIKLGLDKKYEGVVEPEGEFELTEAIEDGPRPFKVFLDVGLKRTSTGARVFGAMKGASDGGLYVPHSPSRFPGWDIETEELDDETLRKYIYGGHVAEYMEMLIDDDEERYQKQFSSLIADGIESDQLEDIYAEAYANIRENPLPEKSTKDKAAIKAESLKYKQNKLTNAERKARVQAKIVAAGRA
ncbi:60S ribosomal protein L5 [Schizosaccharomyces japonicus yFS275]|uniref:Large ribosomal subunit protein uL18 C-terminal eukaryotes domain-containing protein n=1 Tax=Schizosaccharomyces japonicus (strain yFS275 / FY16936) TaxID=402676 RepID=B6JYA7_SCHJY|nr:60S ribosomal protein L5 [Schizosaccharomyces japonicus yFS275]EEB06525.2 hypothetical protein SJAG_01568 [Schizosaccharomyces japonicus yFS275]